MPVYEYGYVDKSKEVAYWKKYYTDKGCSYLKTMKLVYRKVK